MWQGKALGYFLATETGYLWRTFLNFYCFLPDKCQDYTQKNGAVSKVNSSDNCPCFSCAISSSLLMLTAGPRDQFPRWRHSRRRLSVCSVLRYPDLSLQCSVSFVHGLEKTHYTRIISGLYIWNYDKSVLYIWNYDTVALYFLNYDTIALYIWNYETIALYIRNYDTIALYVYLKLWDDCIIYVKLCHDFIICLKLWHDCIIFLKLWHDCIIYLKLWQDCIIYLKLWHDCIIYVKLCHDCIIQYIWNYDTIALYRVRQANLLFCFYINIKKEVS
jgi:hypothetical protein